MEIILTQAQIEEAVAAHLMKNLLNHKVSDISFTVGRKDGGSVSCSARVEPAEPVENTPPPIYHGSPIAFFATQEDQPEVHVSTDTSQEPVDEKVDSEDEPKTARPPIFKHGK
jgi:hypothetical protein